jgi:flavin reductase (DIM6/NTAB) family NADH-FMN oxidoreductase RutF
LEGSRSDAGESEGFEEFATADLAARDRYKLLTSLVVPRPIAWLSTVSSAGVPNLAPFSYFGALASDPMLLGVSIGFRRDGQPKDSLTNIRETRAFCVNVVTLGQLEAMNVSSADLPPHDSEFEFGEIGLAWSQPAGVPFVADCPAVLECSLDKEVDLGAAKNVLVIGEVQRVRLVAGVRGESGFDVDPERLQAVGRLGGLSYAPQGSVLNLGRPQR